MSAGKLSAQASHAVLIALEGLSTEDHARVLGLLHQTAEATEGRARSRRRAEKPEEPTPPTK